MEGRLSRQGIEMIYHVREFEGRSRARLGKKVFSVSGSPKYGGRWPMLFSSELTTWTAIGAATAANKKIKEHVEVESNSLSLGHHW